MHSLAAMAMMLTLSTAMGAHQVLIETESFTNLGGWVVDQQAMDQMGSPYLLAHGLGAPVKNATTTVTFPAAGTYRVWARTFDWVARWKAPGHPGRFEVMIDGRPLPTTFGTKGADWSWHYGGEVQITKRTVAVALHDLTGFEGRCDAIVFTTDGKFQPPNDLVTLTTFRRSALGLPAAPDAAGTFDLVVVGGGIAGTCVAVSSARLGLKVALVQDRPALGGNNSSEVRVWLSGRANTKPYPFIGEIVREMDTRQKTCPATAAEYADDRKVALVKAEPNISLFLNYHANEVETQGGHIVAVVAQHILTARRLRFVGRWFADCTGDGTVGFLAGADHEMTRKGHMGRTNLWRVVDTGKPCSFPRCPWAHDLSDRPFPHQLSRLGKWFWESGFDHDPIAAGERIRDNNFRAMYGAWDCLKNVRKLYPNHQLEWAAYIAGKRESRRLLGDVVLTKDDLMQTREYPDGCVPTSWSIDLHLPAKTYVKGFEQDPFISQAHFTQYKRPYWIPYRCFYSRNVANLFMAGRDVSVTHEALGTARVMRTTGMMGEVVGRAAYLCKTHQTDPCGVYESHLDELKGLLSKRLSKPKPRVVPDWLKNAGKNLALDAKVTVLASRNADEWPPNQINDGEADTDRNELRWLSAPQLPHWIELTWEEPQTIGIVRIISGYNSGSRVADPIADFVLQRHDGHEWRDIDGTQVKGNRDVDWHVAFGPIVTCRLRLLVTKTQINISRIWEVEVYTAPASNQ